MSCPFGPARSEFIVVRLLVVGVLQYFHQTVQRTRITRSKCINGLLCKIIAQDVFRVHTIHCCTALRIRHAILPHPITILT